MLCNRKTDKMLRKTEIRMAATHCNLFSAMSFFPHLMVAPHRPLLYKDIDDENIVCRAVRKRQNKLL